MGDGGAGGGGEGAFGGADASGEGTGSAFGGASGEAGYGGGGGIGGGGFGGGGIWEKPIQVVAPVVAPAESPKVTEGKKAVSRSARRRSLLADEEGGLESVPIYRRSLLGS